MRFALLICIAALVLAGVVLKLSLDPGVGSPVLIPLFELATVCCLQPGRRAVMRLKGFEYRFIAPSPPDWVHQTVPLIRGGESVLSCHTLFGDDDRSKLSLPQGVKNQDASEGMERSWEEGEGLREIVGGG